MGEWYINDISGYEHGKLHIYVCCEQKTVWMKLNETNIQIELQRTTAPSRVLQSVTMIRMWLGQFFRWLSVLVLKKIWILGKWSGYDKRSLRISSCWWFQPSWKILVNGKDYLIYYGKKNVPNHQPVIKCMTTTHTAAWDRWIWRLASGDLQELANLLVANQSSDVLGKWCHL